MDGNIFFRTCICFFFLVFPWEFAQGQQNGFVHADGNRLVDGRGQPLTLRGVQFDNGVMLEAQDSPYRSEHGEADFRRAAAMGFNCVRFGLTYKQFETDSAPGAWRQAAFDWLDANISWARRSGIGLILAVMVPQGGYQSNSEGDALWNQGSNQDRFIALWSEIARRYSNEPAVYGYGLLNEPVVTKGIGQWKDLADRLLSAIRSRDRNHLIVVERMNVDKAAGSRSHDVDQNGAMNFFLMNDANVMYEFHFYNPIEFTHQGASWMTDMDGATGPAWPDPFRVEVREPVGGDTVRSVESGRAGSGNTEWTRFVSAPIAIKGRGNIIGRIGLKGNGIGAGTAWYDDVSVMEYDESGEEAGNHSWDFNSDQRLFFWTSSGKGTGAWTPGEGRDGSACWKISGTGSDGCLFDGRYLFKAQSGRKYVISGWVKGSNLPRGSYAGLWMGFNNVGESFPWSKEYLAAEMDRYLAFGKKNNVPLFMGEFGTISGSFSAGRGGIRWVRDMLEFCNEKNINYSYISWHGPDFGIYGNPVWEPVNEASGNIELIELFTNMQKR